MWISVAKRGEMAAGTVKVVRAGELELALVSAADGFFAVENACPHAGGPLGEGQLEGCVLTCPLHDWRFNVKTGQCLDQEQDAKTYAVRVEGDDVQVRVPDTAEARPGREEAVAKAAERAARKSPVEIWKAQKHGLDIWPDILRFAQSATPMSKIDKAELERMKWYGFFYRKNHDNDRYMCRIRIPGCEMTADQARTLAFLAYESGHGIADVTTRGNVQIQGLTIDKLPGVRAALERVGLTSRQSGHDNVRNVTSHPWSGLDPEELIDTRALAHELHAMIVGSRELSDLPRKFNLALVGRSDAATHAWTQDLCFVAARGPGNVLGFRPLLGGKQGSSPQLAWPMAVFVRPEQVVGVSAAILRTFRELGSRHNRSQVRLCHLVERLGQARLLCEVEERLGYELEVLTAPAATPPAAGEDFIGWFQQKQEGLWMAGVSVPVGRLNWDQLDGLATVAREHGNGTLRTTYDQNLILPGIPSQSRQEVEHELACWGLSTAPDSVSRNLLACTGRQFCNIAVTETKGYSYWLMEELRRRKIQLPGIKINLSGCPSSCAMSHTADVGLKGTKARRHGIVVDAFDVYLGGALAGEVKLGILYRKAVPFDQLPDLLEKLIGEFFLHRGVGESFSQFWHSRLAEHQADKATGDLPCWLCSRCGHHHVADDPPPFCPLCSALRAHFDPAPEGHRPPPYGSRRDVGSSSLPLAGAVKVSTKPALGAGSPP